MVKVERVCESVELGEGPHWDVQSQCLYYVDIFGKAVHKYTPSTNSHKKFVLDENVSFVIPIENAPNKFLISIKRDIAIATWDGVSEKPSSIEKIAEVDTDPETLGNRINDAKCDPSGRLWAGTMGEEKELGHITPNMGSLYSLDANKKIRKHDTGIGCSNGLAWSSDKTKFYYIDSPTRCIFCYNYDHENGTVSGRRAVFSLDETGVPGFPDGQTIDSDGNLWVAIFNGSRVIQIDPREKNRLLNQVEIPAKQVTSVAFGGENLDELYVTSARFEIDGEKLSPPDHGAVFKVTGLGVKGLPAVNFKM